MSLAKAHGEVLGIWLLALPGFTLCLNEEVPSLANCEILSLALISMGTVYARNRRGRLAEYPSSTKDAVASTV